MSSTEVSYAAVFSRIPPPAGIWTWPAVVVGQFIVALSFAGGSSHYLVAGPVWAAVTIAVLAAVPFSRSWGAGTIAIAATGVTCLSSLAGTA